MRRRKVAGLIFGDIGRDDVMLLVSHSFLNLIRLHHKSPKQHGKKKLNIYRTCVLFPRICANPNFFIHEEQNSILTSLHSAHNKNKNYHRHTIDSLLLRCVFIKNEEIYVITAPSFVVGKHFFCKSASTKDGNAFIVEITRSFLPPLLKCFLRQVLRRGRQLRRCCTLEMHILEMYLQVFFGSIFQPIYPFTFLLLLFLLGRFRSQRSQKHSSAPGRCQSEFPAANYRECFQMLRGKNSNPLDSLLLITLLSLGFICAWVSDHF